MSALPWHPPAQYENADPLGDVWDLLERPEWHAQAACRGSDPDIWFPARGVAGPELRVLQAVCETCLVQAECLASGMDEVFGIWGGLSAKKRMKLKGRRGPRPPCGSEEGFRYHTSRNEKSCEPCWLAHGQVLLERSHLLNGRNLKYAQRVAAGWCCACANGRYRDCNRDDCVHRAERGLL